MSSGNHNLRTFVGTFNFNDIGFHSFVILINFTGDLFVNAQYSFNFTQINIHVFVFHTLDDTGYDILFTTLETFINHSTFSFTNALYYNLFSVLSSDTTEVFRSNFDFNDIFYFITSVNFFSISQGNFVIFKFFFIYNGADCKNMKLTGFFVHFYFNILVGTKIFLISSYQSFFNSLEQKFRFNTFLLSQFLDCQDKICVQFLRLPIFNF